jgi:hypothetical protein
MVTSRRRVAGDIGSLVAGQEECGVIRWNLKDTFDKRAQHDIGDAAELMLKPAARAKTRNFRISRGVPLASRGQATSRDG